MKRVLLFLILLAGAGGTGYLCAQSSETVSVWKDPDYQQSNAVEVQLVVEVETTTEETTETTTEETTEETTETAQDTLPDYQDAIGTYVVKTSCALADTAGGEAGGQELAVNLVVAVTAQEDVNGTAWDLVEYYGMSGWLPDADLTRLGDGQKMQESAGTWLFVEPGETVVVYDEACTAEDRAALTAGEASQTAEAGTLAYGTALTVEEADGNWVRVSTGETSGWISAVSAASCYANTYYYADTDINLRSGPGTDNEKVGTLSVGTTLIPAEFQNGWAKVEAGGVTGWAALYYMTPCETSDGGKALAVTSTPTPTPTPAAQKAADGTGTANSQQTTAGGSQATVTQPTAAPETPSSGGGAATTETPSAVTTETPSAVTTETPSAVTTETPSVVTTETPSVVTTETSSAVTTENTSGATTESPSEATTESSSEVTTAATENTSGGGAATTESPSEVTTAAANTSSGSGSGLEEIPESELGADDVLVWE